MDVLSGHLAVRGGLDGAGPGGSLVGGGEGGQGAGLRLVLGLGNVRNRGQIANHLRGIHQLVSARPADPPPLAAIILKRPVLSPIQPFVTFQMAEVAVPGELFAQILDKINRLRLVPGTG